MGSGIFVISLDYEMLWGAIFNKSVEDGYRYRTRYMEHIIPGLLEVFEKYNIHATWAIVGAIGCESKDEAMIYASKDICDPYSNQTLLDYIGDIRAEESKFYFAKDTIKKISKIDGQEIGSHTYTHFYYKEHNEPLLKLVAELNASQKILKELTGTTVTSLVMPKNQVSEDIKQAMSKTEMNTYRGVQVSKRFNRRNIFFKIARFLDAYIPICGDSTFDIKDIQENEFFNVRASAFWRTYLKKLSILEPLKIFRIKQQMNYAAKKGRVFHLWFHPHNLSSEYVKNLQTLEVILNYYKQLHDKYGMESLNMQECAIRCERV